LWSTIGIFGSVVSCRCWHRARTRAQQPYAEISYQSGGLRIQGYFYQPDGSGPFPTLIYNHGSRAGFERRPIPWVRLAGLYVAAGYAVLVPERRGYGRLSHAL
jgi:dipeptidyl aminopeptidase/acylaminoacyl peptidase